MPGPNLSPRSSMAKLAPSVAAAAAAASASASTSASASAASGPIAPPRSKKAVTRAVYADSPFSRKSRGAIRGRSQTSTRRFDKALANFEKAMASQPRRSLSRTKSTRNVNKPKQVRRRSLPNFSPESKFSKGPPKGEFMKLTEGLSEDKKAKIINAMALRAMGNMKKLPKHYFVDKEAVANLEEEQKKAREEMHQKVAAEKHIELKKEKKKLDKLDNELKKLKKDHQAKGSKVLTIPSNMKSYIKRLNELAQPNMSPEGASKMTPLEAAYMNQYNQLNEYVQKLSRDYEESGKAVAEEEAVLNAERAKLRANKLQAKNELLEMERQIRAKAAVELKASEAAKEKRLKKEQKIAEAAKTFTDKISRSNSETRVGNVLATEVTNFGKKRSSKKGSKKKPRGASKKKVGGYSNSNKPNNYGLYP